MVPAGLGCYHSIPEARRDAYAAGVTAAARPGATMLLFGFAPGTGRRPPGVSAEELRTRFPGWDLRGATRGTDRIETWVPPRAPPLTAPGRVTNHRG